MPVKTKSNRENVSLIDPLIVQVLINGNETNSEDKDGIFVL